MADGGLTLEVRTPQGIVLRANVRSLRVPTDTGLVGLRPRSEAAALVVQPGLVIADEGAARRFVATAGGLLRCDGHAAILLTPLAVVGETADRVSAELNAALETPGIDLQLRALLQRLETAVLKELRGQPRVASGGRELG